MKTAQSSGDAHRFQDPEIQRTLTSIDEAEQCEGRLNRQGQKADHVVRYNLTAPDSGDDLDFARLIDARRILAKSL